MAKKKEKQFDPMPDDLLALQDEYISVDAEITRLEERKKQLQDRMLELMQTHDLKKAENERIRISYIAPSKRKNFDKPDSKRNTRICMLNIWLMWKRKHL